MQKQVAFKKVVMTDQQIVWREAYKTGDRIVPDEFAQSAPVPLRPLCVEASTGAPSGASAGACAGPSVLRCPPSAPGPRAKMAGLGEQLMSKRN